MGDLYVNFRGIRIQEGEIFGFLGPSGAGKTTVQNIMTGIVRIQQGDIYYDRQSIRSIKSGFYNKIGVSFENPNIYTKLTGYENLKYFAGLFNVPTEDPVKLLEMVGLSADADKKAGQYSKGMKQRLVFARSMINSPQIWFLDEPTAGLDPNTADVIKNIIKTRKKHGVTIFLTTHNMQVADELCDQVAFINEGGIAAIDSPRNLKLKYGEKSVKVEYKENEEVKSAVYFFTKEVEKQELMHVLNTKEIQTVHSQEASLEEIFMKLTGRGLG